MSDYYNKSHSKALAHHLAKLYGGVADLISYSYGDLKDNK